MRFPILCIQFCKFITAPTNNILCTNIIGEGETEYPPNEAGLDGHHAACVKYNFFIYSNFSLYKVTVMLRVTMKCLIKLF